MIVEQVWTGNAYRNFNYLIACPETGEALAIDPIDFKKCLGVAKARGWNITQILNTHEHGDHIGGNKGVADATGASIIAHKNAGGRIPNMSRGVGAGEHRGVIDAVAHHGHGPDPRRERRRQGAGRARDPRAQSAS